MRESSIIAALRRRAGQQPAHPSIVHGIGDDCAVVRPNGREDLVFTSDFVLEGRHFRRSSHQPADIGHQALARSLSDLAAMGSTPVFCLVSLAVPNALSGRWVDGFYRGLLQLATRSKITLAGGDLASFPKVIADVMCCGRLPRDTALLRSGAKPGDAIYVTGELGASAQAFRAGPGSVYWKRHLRPEPRVEIGVRLRRLGASACIDLSDGLSLDLRRLCLESKVSAELDSNIPQAAGVSLDDALHGGEDYELLFTAPPSRRVPASIAGIAITRIGIITKGIPGRVRYKGRILKPGGFDHFA